MLSTVWHLVALRMLSACRKEEMHLEEKEAETVQMSANLLQTCAAERSLFCRGVAPGSARVFRWAGSPNHVAWQGSTSNHAAVMMYGHELILTSSLA